MNKDLYFDYLPNNEDEQPRKIPKQIQDLYAEHAEDRGATLE